MKLLAVFAFSSFFFPIVAFAFISMPAKHLSSGQELNLNLDDGTTLVVFLSSKCGCSLGHLDHFADLVPLFPDVKFYGVFSNSDEDISQATKIYSKLSGFNLVLDDQSAILNRFKAVRTPQVFLLKDGKVVYKGGVTDSSSAKQAKEFFVKSVLEDLRSGKAPRYSSRRALGCQIIRN